jgi:hypothetical protein
LVIVYDKYCCHAASPLKNLSPELILYFILDCIGVKEKKKSGES